MCMHAHVMLIVILNRSTWFLFIPALYFVWIFFVELNTSYMIHLMLWFCDTLQKASLTKLRKVLRAIRRHFSDPPEKMLKNNAIDAILDSLDIDEAKLSCMVLNHANINEVLGYVLTKPFHINSTTVKAVSTIGDAVGSEEGEDERQQYKEVYENMYYLLSQVEETCASDKWPGFVLSKEGEEFVEQNVKLFKYDLVYNISRFESWQNLANLYDEVIHLTIFEISRPVVRF